jgi:hypothetical protein
LVRTVRRILFLRKKRGGEGRRGRKERRKEKKR